MSESAWDRSRPPASPSESSASAGRASASLRSASSPDSLDSSAARAAAGVRHSVRSLRGGLHAALLCLPLLAGLAAPAAAQTLSLTLGSNSGNEGDSGARFVDLDIALSPAHSANTRFLLCVKNTGTATFRADQPDSSKDFDLTHRNMNTGLTLDGNNCHTYNIAGGSTTSGVSLRIFGDTSFEPDETAVVELRRHSSTPSAVSISSTVGSGTYTIRNDDGAPVAADPDAMLSLIWTESIPPIPPYASRVLGRTGREPAKEVHEGDSGTTDVPFYVRTERLHSSKLPFRVCVTGSATQSTTSSPRPDVEDDYQVVVDNAVQGASCFDTSIPANQRYKRMAIRILNDDRFEDNDGEQVRIALSQAPGNPLPAPFGLVSEESGHRKLSLRIQDDDWWQQPVQFSPAEYEEDFRIRQRRVKEGSNSGRVGLMFTRDKAAWGMYTVTYRVVHDDPESTATYGADYTLGGYNRNTDRGTFRVPERVGAALNVNVVDDRLVEGEETFVIEMVSIDDDTRLVNTGNDRHRLSIAIDDNDNPAYLRVNPEQATLGADGAERRITMSAGVPLPVDVHFEYCVEEGAATLGTDYELTGPDGSKVTATGCHLATLPAGSAGIDLTVRMLDGDDRIEPDEQVRIRLRESTVPGRETASSTVAIRILPSTVERDKDGNEVNMAAIVTLKDDDKPTLEVVGQKGAGRDGDLIAFTVRAVNGPFDRSLTLHWKLDDPGNLINGDTEIVTTSHTCTRYLRDLGICTGSSFTHTGKSPVHREKSGSTSLARGETEIDLDFLVRSGGPDGSVTFTASEGSSFRLAPGKGSACVAIRGGACSGGQGGGSDDTVVPPQPTAAVANVQVAAVDAASATVTWDAVEHATSYRVEYAGTAGDPRNNVQGSVDGHTDTTWTFEHNAAEAMTVTVTVTPEYVDGNGDTQRLAALAGTATLDVAPPQPTAAVANVQVAAVDAASATVTWDAVEHATSYLVEYAGTASDPQNIVQGSVDGHTDTTWTFEHDAAEAMTLTVTVTPEYVDGNGDTQRLADLAGTATIDVAPAGTQDGDTQTVQAHSCDLASVKADVSRYVGETQYGNAHVARWKKALAGLNEEAGGMTAAGAQQMMATYSPGRWQPVVDALDCLEEAAAGEDTTVQADPEIAVSGGNGIAEGGTASFTVTATPAPSAPLAVTLTVGQSGDYAASGETGTRQVTVPTGGSMTFEVATADDGADEPDGAVSATVEAGTGYTVGSASTATVSVTDDDDPVPDPVTPELRLSAGTAVDEGGSAMFTVHADAAPAADLTVELTVAQTGDVLGAPGAGSRQLTLAAGTTSATLALATDDDGVDEPDGAAIVTLDAGAGYTVAAGQAAGTVAVRDNDDPVVSIAAGAGVTEGTPASFTLTANPAPHAALTVSLAVTQSGDFAASGQTGTRQVTIPVAGSIAFEVATVNDTADEPDGSVTATLAAGSGYAVAASPDDAASVAVADDDVAAAGVPTLSVDDAEAHENEWWLRYTIRLSPASDRDVSVWVNTRESTPVSAQDGADYEGMGWGTRVVFPAGWTERDLRITLVNDSHDEDAETFEVVLLAPQGAEIADGVGVMTIVNDDPMPAAFLARFGRTVAEQALDGIAARIAAPRDPGFAGSFAGHVDLGSLAARGDAGTGEDSVHDAATALAADGHGIGRAAPKGSHGIGQVPPDGHGPALVLSAAEDDGGDGSGNAARGSLSGTVFASGHAGGDGTEVRSVTLEEAMLATGFTATRGTDAAGGSLAFWGRAGLSGFDGREGTFSLDGEAATAMLGADYARGRWLAGLMVMQSSGDGGYADAGTGDARCSQDLDAEARTVLCGGAVREGDGDVEASLTAAVPWAAYRASERVRLWGALGRGTGEVTLVPEAGGGPLAAGLSWSMASAAMRGYLRAPSGAFPALAETADALATRTSSDATDGLAASESDTSRLRVGIEGSWNLALGDGGRLRPRLEIGARRDGGDAETGLGIELGGGVSWTDPGLGLSLDLSGRTLLMHDDGDLADRGVSLSVTFDPDPGTKRGPTISMKQDLGGAASGGIDALFAHDPLEDRAGGDAGVRRTVEAAWGLPALGGRFTGSPHAGLSTAGDARDWTLGWRLAPEGERLGTPDLTFGTRAVRREGGDGQATHSVGVEAGIRW